MRFRATIKSGGKTATGIEIPASVVEGLDAGKKPLVKVTINGYAYRSAIATMGGRFMVGVSAEVRAAAGVAGGDTVDVELQVDTEPRTVAVPPALAKALAGNAKAEQAFDALSNSAKTRLTAPIEKAKADETRERNVKKAMDSLRVGASVAGRR